MASLLVKVFHGGRYTSGLRICNAHITEAAVCVAQKLNRNCYSESKCRMPPDLSHFVPKLDFKEADTLTSITICALKPVYNIFSKFQQNFKTKEAFNTCPILTPKQFSKGKIPERNGQLETKLILIRYYYILKLLVRFQ